MELLVCAVVGIQRDDLVGVEQDPESADVLSAQVVPVEGQPQPFGGACRPDPVA